VKHKNLLKNPSSLPGVFCTLSIFGVSIFKVYNCAYFNSSYLSASLPFPLSSILSSSYFCGTFSCFSIKSFLASTDFYSGTIGGYSSLGISYFLTLVSSMVASSQGGGSFRLSSNNSLSMSAGLSTVLYWYGTPTSFSVVLILCFLGLS
jgi:hypothetical protein